jgi:exonuclease SbcD
MRILHTADWHLCDRLGRQPRTDDLRRAVERVAGYGASEQVDVLLVAGDLFSEMARHDELRDAIAHLQQTFADFLGGGGTVLALTGNHDNEVFCQTLRGAMALAAPLSGKFGERAAPGRFYLAVGPTLLRLADPAGRGEVQFVLMPYPTPARYLEGETAQRYDSQDEKNRHMLAAYTARLQAILGHERFDKSLPTVLSAHVAVRGSVTSGSSLFRLSEKEDVIVSDEDLPTGFAYVALGHIHNPQCVGGQAHVRYSGSIERMDLGEELDDKSVVVFDVGPAGLVGEPRVLPMPAARVYRVEMHSPKADLPALREQYPDAADDLVRVEFTWKAGEDDLNDVLRQLDAIFPRCYYRDFKEVGALGETLTVGEHATSKSFEQTVMDYLRQELTNHDEALRDGVLARAEALMKEELA